MNNTNPLTKWVKRISSIMAVIALITVQSQGAYARILFEDDEYFNVQSEGIIMDVNDNVDPGAASVTDSEGATYTAVTPGTAGDNIDIVIVDGAACDINTPTGACTTVVGDVITITVDLDDANADTTTGDNVTSAMIVAEIQANAEAAALITASSGDATAVTAGTINLGGTTAGVDPGQIELQFGNDGTDATITYNDYTQDLVFDTPGGDVDFSDDNLTTTGAIYFQDTSEFHMRELATIVSGVTSCTTTGEMALALDTLKVYICTDADTDEWTTAGPQDFEDVYEYDDDNTLTADSTFDIDATGAVGIDSDAAVTIGGAGISLTSDGGVLSLTGDGTNDIDISNAGGAIDLDSATFDLDTTGAFSLDGVGASNITTDSGDLTLNTTTSGDVDIDGADNVTIDSGTGDITLTGGDDIFFDDAQLTGLVQLSDTATDWDTTFDSDGIIDNINSFTWFTAGDGADNVGVEDGSLLNIAAVRAELVDATNTITYIAQDGGTAGNSITVTLVETPAGDLGGDLATIDVSLSSPNNIVVTFQDDNGATSSNPESVGQLDIVQCINSAINITTDGSGSTAGDGISCTITDDVTGLITAVGGTAVTDAVALTTTNLAGGLASGLPNSSTVQDALERLDLQWGDLYSTHGASLVGIEDTGDYFIGDTVEEALQELGSNAANNYEDLTFYPEYPDSTISADGADNKGTLESFYDDTADMGYYNWTSTKATQQDIDIHFTFPIPSDFDYTNDFTFEYRTGTVTDTDNDVEIRLFNVTDGMVQCASDTSNTTAGVWATGTITAAAINVGCTGGTALDAGDIVEVRIKLLDNNVASTYADVGVLEWDYTRI